MKTVRFIRETLHILLFPCSKPELNSQLTWQRKKLWNRFIELESGGAWWVCLPISWPFKSPIHSPFSHWLTRRVYLTVHFSWLGEKSKPGKKVRSSETGHLPHFLQSFFFSSNLYFTGEGVSFPFILSKLLELIKKKSWALRGVRRADKHFGIIFTEPGSIPFR